jgi:type III pantothenate kinase
MLLLIDAGNTSVKWALLEASAPLGEWIASGIVPHADLAQLAAAWHDVAITRVLASNVAGDDMKNALQTLLSRALGLRPVPLEWFASSPQAAGVRNAYRQPTQLGCDRFASAIGARALYPDQSLIVATCGTATTIDAISGDGVFQGGMILPGLTLMAHSLAKNTAQLPQVTTNASAAMFADNTDDAIASGCLNAQVGAIERAVAAGAKSGPVTCLLSGGAASQISPLLTIPHTRVDHLVLIGLQVVAAQS